MFSRSRHSRQPAQPAKLVLVMTLLWIVFACADAMPHPGARSFRAPYDPGPEGLDCIGVRCAARAIEPPVEEMHMAGRYTITGQAEWATRVVFGAQRSGEDAVSPFMNQGVDHSRRYAKSSNRDSACGARVLHDEAASDISDPGEDADSPGGVENWTWQRVFEGLGTLRATENLLNTLDWGSVD